MQTDAQFAVYHAILLGRRICAFFYVESSERLPQRVRLRDLIDSATIGSSPQLARSHDRVNQEATKVR